MHSITHFYFQHSSDKNYSKRLYIAIELFSQNSRSFSRLSSNTRGTLMTILAIVSILNEDKHTFIQIVSTPFFDYSGKRCMTIRQGKGINPTNNLFNALHHPYEFVRIHALISATSMKINKPQPLVFLNLVDQKSMPRR